MLYKIFKYIAMIFGVVGAYFIVRTWVAGEEAIKASADLQSSIISPYLYVGYIALILAALVALFVAFKDLFKGNIKKTLATIGVLAVIIIISYLVSSGQPMSANGVTYSANTVRWISAGLYSFYILGILAIISLVLSGVKRLIS